MRNEPPPPHALSDIQFKNMNVHKRHIRECALQLKRCVHELSVAKEIGAQQLARPRQTWIAAAISWVYDTIHPPRMIAEMAQRTKAVRIAKAGLVCQYAGFKVYAMSAGLRMDDATYDPDLYAYLHELDHMLPPDMLTDSHSHPNTPIENEK